MPTFLCAAGWMGECCSRPHTSVMRITAPSEKVASARFSLLLKANNRDIDEEPVIMPDLPMSDLLPVTVAVVRDSTGEARGYDLTCVRSVALARSLVSQVNADHFNLAQGVTWTQFEEALE